MTTPVTVLAPIKIAQGKTESDLLQASERFQEEFARHQPGILRRELIRKSEGEYIDIVQFRSAKDAQDVMEKEQESEACHAFFSVMDLSDMNDEDLTPYPSLATYI